MAYGWDIYYKASDCWKRVAWTLTTPGQLTMEGLERDLFDNSADGVWEISGGWEVKREYDDGTRDVIREYRVVRADSPAPTA